MEEREVEEGEVEEGEGEWNLYTLKMICRLILTAK